jgi:hypothetical protein
LTHIFDVIGILGGWLVAVDLFGMSEGAYFEGMYAGTKWNDVEMGLVKSIVFGLIIGWIIRHRQERAVEAERRREKVLDVQRALHAEISAHLHQLQMDDLVAHKAAMVARIAGDPEFVPLVPKQTHAMIFEAIVGEIQVLPEEAITPVSLYYGQILGVANFADEFRSEAFANMSPRRRAEMYGDFMDMKMMSLSLGQKAIRGIERSYARTSGTQIGVNNRVSVLSDRQGAE